jgi:hypothetical protein
VASDQALARAHVRFGWTALAVYLALGLVLEGLHGFKVAWYLDVGAENRRLLLTLGHAHGTLLAVLNLALAATVTHLGAGAARTVASWGLRTATIVLPAGFLLGGVWLAGTDPSVSVLLVPIGGLALLAAVGAAAVASWRREPPGS